MKNHTLNKRYARALMSLGLDDGNFDKYGQELSQLSTAMLGLGDELACLTSPILPEAIRRKMLLAILSKASLSPIVSNFAQLLLDKGHLADLPDITKAYQTMSDKEKGIVRAQITSAVPLGPSDIKDLGLSLNKFTNSQVLLTIEHDPSIIGGLVARMGDLVIDGSVRTQLNKLSERLDRL